MRTDKLTIKAQEAVADRHVTKAEARMFSAPVIQHQYTVLTPEVVRTLHENEIAVWSWSTTDEASMLFSIECGADALMGDDAKLMLEVLDRVRPR